MIARTLRLGAALGACLLFAGCANTPKSLDYTAYKASRPHSILVLPPVNESPDVKASYGMLSQVTYPLAEAGYYVMPVALVDETFRQNGLTTPGDIAQVPPAKLHEIFGADAAMYVDVTQYGTQYKVLASDTRVEAKARLVDLKSGATLWTGTAVASSEEGKQNQGGIIGMLIAAAVNQIISGLKDDPAFPIAGMTSARLFSVHANTGLLYGPRNPKYQTD